MVAKLLCVCVTRGGRVTLRDTWRPSYAAWRPSYAAWHVEAE